MNNADISTLSANCREKKANRAENGIESTRHFAVIRLTVDFFEENQNRSGKKSLACLIRILQKIIKADCGEEERIIQKSAEGLDVLVLHRQPDELDQRIFEWGCRFYRSVGEPFPSHDLSFSAGIYEIGNSYDADATAQYMRKANFAKSFGHIGSNPFARYYDDSDYQALRRQRYLETQMPAALREGQMVIYLQPQYSLSAQKIVGAEALVRWKHPKLGMLMPDDFIPLLEHDRCILRLDFYVLEEVCRLLRRWRSSGMPVLPVSVNFSKQHAVTGDFMLRFLGTVERYQVRPEELCVEWTENVFARAGVPIARIAGQLKSRGFRIALDDFGSGYSSLNTLTDLPVDIIKLDKQFLNFDRQDRRRRFLLQQIIRIAGELHYTVLAEGVEYAWQAELLHHLGYDYVQGFLYSPPVPVSAYEQMIRAQTANRYKAAESSAL